MQNYRLIFNTQANIDEMWDLLTELGVSVLYSDEDLKGYKEIYIQLPAEEERDKWHALMPDLLSIELQSLPEIDWNEQWQLHGHDFQEGFVHIDLMEFGYVAAKKNKFEALIKLQPGPGFGNLSHPTTALMLELMANQVQEKTVADIGCGSGVLTLAALAMGAEFTLAIDIDPEALVHTRQNALLNHMAEKVRVCLPEELKTVNEEVVVLINMISSEQQMAWESVKQALPHIKKIMSSGIRASDKKAYLALVSKWGWKEERCLEKDQWLGFEFCLDSQ